MAENEEKRKTNFNTYKYLISNLNQSDNDIDKKITFDEDLFIITNVNEDENCFFRCISLYFTGNEKYHFFL